MSYECWSLDAIPDGDEEMREGYKDGRAGEPEPGSNRHPAYIHGWWTGACDGHHREIPPWMRALAKQYLARPRGSL